MMTRTVAAAIGALILAASAAPAAFAGGYWDGGIVQGGQAADSPAYGDRDCPCYCPSDRDRHDQRWGERDRDDRSWSDRDRDYGDDNARSWSDQRGYDSGWQGDDAYQDDSDYQDQDTAPAEYADDGYGVGPDAYYDEGGGGGGFVGGGSFVDAGAFADIDVDINARDRFRDRFHERDMHDDHHMQPYPPHMMQHDNRPYSPQHTSGWSTPMQPYHSMQPHYSMAPRVYSHPIAVRRSGGGGRRW
jgi:hypothetical protein